MYNFIKRYLKLYIGIVLALIWPTECVKFIMSENVDSKLLAQHINKFRKIYLEALMITILSFFISYLLAGLPKYIPWLKLIPTLLIAFPVYGSRNSDLETHGRDSVAEKMDVIFFKTVYVVGITWLGWDIFKGIV